MAGNLFIMLICTGIYLLLRSYYTNLTIGRFISYFVAIIIVGGVVATLAIELTRFQGTHRMIRTGFDDMEHNVEIIELNADDLDPQIQEALLEAVRRTQRRQVSTDDILKTLEDVKSPPEGVCGVCYDTLDDGDLLSCPECHKAAHKLCLREWLDSGQKVCIYCRHDLVLA